MEQSTESTGYINTLLTKDQQMFVYRWYPIMGAIYCSKEIGINVGTVREFANTVGIPNSTPGYDMTIKEIADRLGMTEVEVQTIFNSAMCKMREAFKNKRINNE